MRVPIRFVWPFSDLAAQATARSENGERMRRRYACGDFEEIEYYVLNSNANNH
jgi:hypothetical protein